MDFAGPEERRRAPATLEHGGPISAGQARMLACDARIIPAVLGGAVAGAGRRGRVPVLPDRDPPGHHPAGPGLLLARLRPPTRLVRRAPHSALGRTWTRAATRTAACSARSITAEIHRGHWVVRLAPDGIPEFIPPPWVDPSQVPRRNTLHHIAEAIAGK